jgi:hypothetical protein
MDREEAERMVKSQGIEVGYDRFIFNGREVLVKSRLQPIFRVASVPLFLTIVYGDVELGLTEYGSSTEEECRQLHVGLVDRYKLIERERAGTHKILLDGVL